MDKQAAYAAIAEAMKLGADYAEIFFEDTSRNSLEYTSGKVENALYGRDFGAGFRAVRGTNCAYAYTCDVSAGALMQAARAAAGALAANANERAKDFAVSPPRPMQTAEIKPSSVGANRRAEIAKRGYVAAKAHSSEIVQASCALMDVEQNVVVANSLGVWAEDKRVRSRLVVSAVASDGQQMQTGFEGPGAGRGFEFFEGIDVESLAQRAAETAITMLHAPFAPAGMMSVAVEGGFGGVIFHEACGHSLEATSVSKGNSVFAGKLGQKIAGDKVSAYDDGTIPASWGSIGYDDEGNPSRKNLLIENGVLKGYMIDMLGGRRMGMSATGNSRRQNYRFLPTSRMTNTFIAAGTDERIIESMAYGLYAKKMGGGSVNPLTGEFNFSVLEGYLVKNGALDSPVRGATLIGKGSQVLMNIDMVGKSLDLGEGMCGSVSGNVPVCVGQPLIRVSELLVGGREAQ